MVLRRWQGRLDIEPGRWDQALDPRSIKSLWAQDKSKVRIGRVIRRSHR